MARIPPIEIPTQATRRAVRALKRGNYLQYRWLESERVRRALARQRDKPWSESGVRVTRIRLKGIL